MKKNKTTTIRVPTSMLITLERVKEIYGCRTQAETAEILCTFFNENCTLKKSSKSLFYKLDIKINKINELLRLRIDLKHIVNILADEIDEENITIEDFKRYLLSRKIYF